MSENLNQITAEEKLSKIQDMWTENIKSLNAMMKDLPSLNELLNKLYSERQNAVDYFFVLQKILLKLSIEYKKEYAFNYNELKKGSAQLRYSTESSISVQIESILSEKKLNIELIDSHCNYMKETIKSIDSIIYAVSQKIKIYELMNGFQVK